MKTKTSTFVVTLFCIIHTNIAFASFFQSPLHSPSKNVVTYFLQRSEKKETQLNKAQKKETLSEKEAQSVVNNLIRHNRLNTKDFDDKTPLNRAVEANNEIMIKVLLQAGATAEYIPVKNRSNKNN